MARRNVVDALRGHDHQHVHGAQGAVGARLGRDQRQRVVDALCALHVHAQRVQEDVGQRVPRDLRQRGVGGLGLALAWWLVQAPRAHHQQALGPQVDGGRQRGRLAHGAVAEVLGVPVHRQCLRRENEGNGRRGQQVLRRDALARCLALRARPACHLRAALEVGHMFARAVARRRDGQRVQVALADQQRQAHQRHHLRQQPLQRSVVQQRMRPRALPACQRPAQRQQREPARAALHHMQRIGVVHLARADVAPHACDAAHRALEVVGPASQGRAIDSTRRSAGDDGKRVGPAPLATVAAQRRNGFEHADLVGGACTAAGKQQTGHGLRGRRGRGHGVCCAGVAARLLGIPSVPPRGGIRAMEKPAGR